MKISKIILLGGVILTAYSAYGWNYKYSSPLSKPEPIIREQRGEARLEGGSEYKATPITVRGGRMYKK
jgi:hypothetical protein